MPSLAIDIPFLEEPSDVVVADGAPGLAEVLREGVAVAICPRALDPALLEVAASFARSATMSVRRTLAPADPASVLACVGEVPPGELRDALAADIELLGTLYATLTRRRHLHFELAVVSDASCPKFHSDAIGLRLLCTYAGPGTEWVPGHEAVHPEIGLLGRSLDAHNAAIVPRASAIRRASAGDVIILKGDGWPGHAGRGAVHRSPALAPGERRLVLKIDAEDCAC